MENYKKKYKDALERASKLRVQNPFDTVSQMMEYVFPELQDKNEKIRNAIIAHIKDLRYYDIFYGVSPEEMVNWLENLKEQKPTDKVEHNTEIK